MVRIGVVVAGDSILIRDFFKTSRVPISDVSDVWLSDEEPRFIERAGTSIQRVYVGSIDVRGQRPLRCTALSGIEQGITLVIAPSRRDAEARTSEVRDAWLSVTGLDGTVEQTGAIVRRQVRRARH
jgi:hypothetical protein